MRTYVFVFEDEEEEELPGVVRRLTVQDHIERQKAQKIEELKKEISELLRVI